MKFPKKESEVISLAQSIQAGLSSHSEDFPSLDPLFLDALIDAYQTAKDSQGNAKSQSILATESKQNALESLQDAMKNMLKKAEVDAAANPDKLYEIGWAPRQKPSDPQVPSLPHDLECIAQGTDDLWLNWQKPAVGSATVRNYIIERRQADQSGSFGEWQLAASTLDKKVHLENQPKGVQLEYRVKAVNTAGQSTPSNTAAVVL